MKKIINDFVIVVDGNFSNQRYIIKEHSRSKSQAIKRAHKLSTLYPASEVLVEHWLLITSHNFIKSGFYKGKVFNTTQEKAA